MTWGDDFYSLKIGQGIFGRRMPLGTAEDIRKVTPQILEEYYQKWYILFGYINYCRRCGSTGDRSPDQKNTFSSLPKRSSDDFRTYPLEYEKKVFIYRKSVTRCRRKQKVELMIPHPCVVERTLGDAVRKKNMGRLLVRAISSRFNGRKLKTNVSDQWYLSDKNHLVLTVEKTEKSY